MGSEEFSGWNQSIDCALAWVILARDWCQIGSTLTKLSLSVSSGGYCISAIGGFRVYGYPLATLFTHYPIVWTVKNSVVGARVLAVL